MVSIRVRIRVRVSFMVWVRENVREGNVQGGCPTVFIYVCISIVFTVYASFGRAPLRLTNVGGRW